MAQQTLNLAIKGLHTYASELSGVPAGALSVADNVNINRLNIVEPRRGFDFLDYPFASSLSRSRKLFIYQSRLFCHYDSKLAIYDPASGWIDYSGTVDALTSTKIRSVESNKNFYFTTATGVKKLDDITVSPKALGCPKGLDLVTADSGVTGFLADTEYVAYRYVIGIKDANKNLILGGVSQRRLHQSAVATGCNVSVTCYIPAGLTAGQHFLQLYRTATSTTVPNDEMQQCYEHPINSTDISNGYVTIVDIVPDDLLGASLYTSPSQQGLVNDNSQPPLARDVAAYKNHVFYAYPTSKHRYFLSLIACGGALGLQVDDTITIGGQTYTAKGTENIGSKHFLVDTASASLSVRIDTTIRSLTRCINQNASSGQYAYLLGDDDSLPGKILLEERSIGGSSFALTSSRATCWSPQLASSGTSQSSDNDEFKNAVFYSKQYQPESVPLKNILYVGSSDSKILRIVALRDGLFILKEDGVFVLRGENESSFALSLLDSTARLIAPESVAVVNNLIYCLAESGVIAISDSGVSLISQPVKDKFLNLFGTCLDQVKDLTFGISYEIDGKYILFLPETSADTSCQQALVYDVFGASWCRWIRDVSCGLVSSVDNKLYLGEGSSSKTLNERKDYAYTDYADAASDQTITAVDGTTLTVSGTSEMSVGDILEQGDLSAYVESIDTTAGTVVVDLDLDWDLTTVTHLKGIPVAIEWNAEFAGNPAGLKLFTECLFLFKQGFLKTMNATFSSDVNAGITEVPITGSDDGGWGSFDFGEVVWGGATNKQPVRLLVPRQASRCSQLIVRLETSVAFSDFQLNGISLVYSPTGTRISA